MAKEWAKIQPPFGSLHHITFFIMRNKPYDYIWPRILIKNGTMLKINNSALHGFFRNNIFDNRVTSKENVFSAPFKAEVGSWLIQIF